jgi:hypothetical protein
MARALCTIDGCDRVVNGHGLCDKHYQRWAKYGDPLGGKSNHAPASERFDRRVKKGGPNDCWFWSGRPTNAGYGIFQIGGKGSRVVSAHRFSYELHKEPIPKGLHIMHSCDNRLCVNPAHLSVGTAKENALDCIAKGRHSSQIRKGL